MKFRLDFIKFIINKGKKYKTSKEFSGNVEVKNAFDLSLSSSESIICAPLMIIVTVSQQSFTYMRFNRQTSGESASLPQYLGCNTVQVITPLGDMACYISDLSHMQN